MSSLRLRNPVRPQTIKLLVAMQGHSRLSLARATTLRLTDLRWTGRDTLHKLKCTRVLPAALQSKGPGGRELTGPGLMLRGCLGR